MWYRACSTVNGLSLFRERGTVVFNNLSIGINSRFWYKGELPPKLRFSSPFKKEDS